eukprot:gene7905-9728_t
MNELPNNNNNSNEFNEFIGGRNRSSSTPTPIIPSSFNLNYLAPTPSSITIHNTGVFNNNNINNNNNNNSLLLFQQLHQKQQELQIEKIDQDFQWLFVGDPLVESIKVKQKETKHDLYLLEGALEEVDNEIKAAVDKKNRILKGIDSIHNDQDRLRQSMLACKQSVMKKWRDMSIKFGFSIDEPVSLFQVLPLEVMINIFENLSFHDINLSIARVCKQWYKISFADSIWKNLFHYRWNNSNLENDHVNQNGCGGGGNGGTISSNSVGHHSECKPLVKVIPASFWTNSLLNHTQQQQQHDPLAMCVGSHILPSSRTITTSDTAETVAGLKSEDGDSNNNNGGSNTKRMRIDWRENYLKRQRIEDNWLKGNHKTIKLQGHTDWITCMQFDGKILATGSWDASLKVWNIETGDCRVLSSLEINSKVGPNAGGHTHGITCVQFQGNRLISGSSDSTLRIWDLSTGECVHILRGHTDGVSCLCIIDDVTLASGSLDNTINLWSMETGKLLHSFTNHISGISCLYYKNNLLISGTMGGTLNVIDIPSRICLQTLHGHGDRVTSIQWWDSSDGDRIVSSSWDYTLRVWNLQTGKAIHVLSGHTFRVRCTQVRGNILVSGSWDTTVKVWDLSTGKCLHTLFGHSFNVWGVQFEGNRLVTAGWDKKVKVWNIDSGKLLYTLEGHTESIICSQFKGSKLVTAAKEIIIYDFDS